MVSVTSWSRYLWHIRLSDKDFVADRFPQIFFDAKLLPAQEPLAHAFGREEGKMR